MRTKLNGTKLEDNSGLKCQQYGSDSHKALNTNDNHGDRFYSIRMMNLLSY